MLTFAKIRTRVLQLIDEADNTASQTTSLVNQRINAVHEKLCLSRPWPFMRWPRRETFTSVVGTRFVALNPSVGRLEWVWDDTDKRLVTLVPMRAQEPNAVNYTTSVDSPSAMYGGFWPVKAKPASAGVLTVVSSSSSDASGPTVIIRGIDSDGEIITETFTMTGTTEVDGSTSFTDILNVTKTGTWVGTLTLSDAADNTLLTLTASQDGKQYPTLEFLEPPRAAHSYIYHFLRTPQELSNNGDIPEIPFPYSQILVYDTLIDLSTYNTEIGISDRQAWEARRKEIMDQLEQAMDEVIAGSLPRQVRDMDANIGYPSQYVS